MVIYKTFFISFNSASVYFYILSLMQEQMKKVLEQAARLQKLVPDAVLVGGSAASIYAEHRFSLDHDHVVAELGNNYA